MTRHEAWESYWRIGALRTLLALSPRGDSLDSLRQRLTLWRLGLRALRGRAWLTGYGPGSTLLAHQRWGVRGQIGEVTLVAA